MEAIHLAQEAIITDQREEIEALKKTVKTYDKKYKFLLDCFYERMIMENSHE